MMGGLQHTTVAQPLLRQSFEFFQAFAEVQSLHLNFKLPAASRFIKNDWDWMNITADLSESLADVVWPKLVSLKLGYCGFTADAFINFMKRYSPRLTSFEAECLALKPPETSWRVPFQSVAPFVTLQSVRLTLLLDKEIKKRFDYGKEDDGNSDLEFINDDYDEHDYEELDSLLDTWKAYSYSVAQYLTCEHSQYSSARREKREDVQW